MCLYFRVKCGQASRAHCVALFDCCTGEQPAHSGALADNAGEGAIYEEIPGITKHLEEREKGYVSITSPGTSDIIRHKETSLASTWTVSHTEEIYSLLER